MRRDFGRRHPLFLVAATTLLHACSSPPPGTSPPLPPAPDREAPAEAEDAPPTSRVPRVVTRTEPPPKLAFTSCLTRTNGVWATTPVVGDPSPPSDDAKLSAADREAEERMADATAKLTRACYEAVWHHDRGAWVWLVVQTKLSTDGEREEVCVGSDETTAEGGMRACVVRAMTSPGLFPVVAGKPRTVTVWYGFQRGDTVPMR